LYFGEKVIEKLGVRFKNKLKNILQNSKKEIKDFIQKNKALLLPKNILKKGLKIFIIILMELR
jgi:hypothetical protein